MEAQRQLDEPELGGFAPVQAVIMTAKIARAHLNEFPDYCTRLAKMEAEAEANRTAGGERAGIVIAWPLTRHARPAGR